MLAGRVVPTAEVAFGVACLWWSSPEQAAVDAATGALRCPTCGGPVQLQRSRREWFRIARRFEQIGFPWHERLIRAIEGQCFRTRTEAWDAFGSRVIQ